MSVLPSQLTGWLVDRYGRTPIAAASGLTLLAAGIKSPPPRRLPRLGWNLGLVSGTAMITDAVPLATRAKNQGMAGVSIAIAGATGGFSSGLVVSASGYPVLALTGGIRSPSSPRSPPVRAAGDPAGPVGGSRPPSPSTAPDTVVHVFARTSSARC